MTKIEITVQRPNGAVETVDMSSKFTGMTKALLGQIKDATRSAGRGTVLSATMTYTRDNSGELRKAYNNLHNEGGDGYVPEENYFRALPQYREWTETAEIMA